MKYCGGSIPDNQKWEQSLIKKSISGGYTMTASSQRQFDDFHHQARIEAVIALVISLLAQSEQSLNAIGL